jgi:hypothetical protein
MSAFSDVDEIVARPEIQDVMRRLAEHGLGVCLPHAHDDDDLLPLPPGLVQYEEELRVSFVPEDSPEATTALPVSWMWDGDRVRVTGRCRQGHTIR